jgi:hypothetical protein
MMATYRQVIEGLQILAAVEGGLDKHSVMAEHDILYAGPSVSDIDDQTRALMLELGWFVSDADCFAVWT